MQLKVHLSRRPNDRSFFKFLNLIFNYFFYGENYTSCWSADQFDSYGLKLKVYKLTLLNICYAFFSPNNGAKMKDQYLHYLSSPCQNTRNNISLLSYWSFLYRTLTLNICQLHVSLSVYISAIHKRFLTYERDH